MFHATVNIANLLLGSVMPVVLTGDVDIPPEYNLSQSTVTIRVDGNMKNRGEFYSFKGRMKAMVTFPCDTCLEQVSCALDVDVEERYLDGTKKPSAGSARKARAEASDVEATEFTGKNIDIGPELESNLLLAIPLRMVCSDDCKGLCFFCGHNLNESHCSCEVN